MNKKKTSKKPASVSFEDEPLIVVNAQDEILGYLDKAACHNGDGVLHRAFSIFIFNGKGQLLIQKRSAGKRLWPMYWSNSCCSHPRKGESYQEAIHRRLREELGFDTDLTFLFKFTYYARYGEEGSERELCSVYVGRSDGPVQVHPEEVAEWQWIDLEELTRDMARNPERYTPWFRMEWDRLLRDHRAQLEQLIGRPLPEPLSREPEE